LQGETEEDPIGTGGFSHRKKGNVTLSPRHKGSGQGEKREENLGREKGRSDVPRGFHPEKRGTLLFLWVTRDQMMGKGEGKEGEGEGERKREEGERERKGDVLTDT
jgi:hypothetical protein